MLHYKGEEEICLFEYQNINKMPVEASSAKKKWIYEKLNLSS